MITNPTELVTRVAVDLMLTAIMNGDPTHVGFFESYEESCMGWDGEEARLYFERQGICEYFRLDAEGFIPRGAQ